MQPHEKDGWQGPSPQQFVDWLRSFKLYRCHVLTEAKFASKRLMLMPED
jgi:hypothetical protein